MKLRIKGNTIRLRLTQTEVDEFAEKGQVADAVVFGQAMRLGYALRADKDATTMRASYDAHQVTVWVPAAAARQWAGSGQVGMAGEVPIDDTAQTLRLLVEKDFQCLHKRPMEDETDQFPHPLKQDA